jgi:hypothetical protein
MNRPEKLPRPRGSTKKGKPRAVGLSREKIVTETLRYLREHPTEPFTLANAGLAVGSTSMAIYRHFSDAGDLADAIIGAVLSDLDQEVSAHDDWRTQVRAWMAGLYKRLLATPQCGSMLTMANGLSTAWLRAAATLRRSLIKGGLEGRALSEAVFWIAMTVTGFARQTLVSPMTRQIEGTVSAMARLAPEEAAELAPFRENIPDIYVNALDIMLDRTIASVEALITKPSRVPETRRR